MFTLFFRGERVVNSTDAAQGGTQRFSRYFWGMIERGVYLPCSQFEANFVSAAHTEDDLAATIAAARDVLSGIA
jgi:glutamate-1-semialdehyde 2,1-aminomutase